MAFNGTLLATSIKGQLTLSKFLGREATKLGDMVGDAVGSVLTRPNQVSCSLSGVVGATGTLSGLVVAGVVSTVMSKLMFSRGGSQLTGRDFQGLCDAISTGICIVLQTSQVQGTAVGIATGVGTGRFQSPTLYTDLYMDMMSRRSYKSFLGRNISNLLDAFSYGIAMHLTQSVAYTVTSVGAPSPTPPTGPVAVTGITSITSFVV